MSSQSSTLRFQREVVDRFGVLPNFFCSADAAPGLVEELWKFAKSAYLDSPLPALFKERLFVHLSRFCEVRYCIVRHVGFLIGQGRPAGDAAAECETIDQVVEMLRRPLPDGAALAPILQRLECTSLGGGFPEPRSQCEGDLFDALTIMFLSPRDSMVARAAVRAAVGDGTFELLVAYLAFIRTAHYWTEMHPDLTYEPDMIEILRGHEDLARLLLDRSEAEIVRDGRRLRDAITQLQRAEVARAELAKANVALEGALVESRFARDQVKALFARIVTVQEEERRRIALDIDDQLGQQMTALRLQIEALQLRAADQPVLSKPIGDARRLADELDQSIDFLTWELSPTALDTLGLSDALEQLVAGWSQRFHIKADYSTRGIRLKRFRADVEINLYRLTQEALHNIFKHASATRVIVSLVHHEAHSMLVIADDGRGFDFAEARRSAAPKNLGLVSMRERAALVGGELRIESGPGGTCVSVQLPVIEVVTVAPSAGRGPALREMH